MCVACQNLRLIVSKHVNQFTIRDADLSIRLKDNKFIFTFEMFALQDTAFHKDASRHRMCVLCCSREIVNDKIVWHNFDGTLTSFPPFIMVEANKLCDRAMRLKVFL